MFGSFSVAAEPSASAVRSFSASVSSAPVSAATSPARAGRDASKSWAASKAMRASDSPDRAAATMSPARFCRSASLSALSTTSSVGSVRSRLARCSPRYSSSVTWKLLPPNPNELTAARRGCSPVRTHGRVCALT